MFLFTCVCNFSACFPIFFLLLLLLLRSELFCFISPFSPTKTSEPIIDCAIVWFYLHKRTVNTIIQCSSAPALNPQLSSTQFNGFLVNYSFQPRARTHTTSALVLALAMTMAAANANSCRFHNFIIFMRFNFSIRSSRCVPNGFHCIFPLHRHTIHGRHTRR